MAKGVNLKRDHIPTGDSKKPSETDTLSSVDKGIDFIKAGETAQVGNSSLTN